MQFILERRKRPDERFRIGVDFTPDLDAGDSIASQAVTAISRKGVDITGTFLTGASLSGNIVLVYLQAGADGDISRVFFKATSVNGSIFEHSVVVNVGLDT